MTDIPSTAPPTRNATPPHIAHPTLTALPTPPASREESRVTQDATADSSSRSSPRPIPAPIPKEITKPTREACAATYVLTFGTHKGQTLQEVGKKNPNYISWLKTSGWAQARGDLGDAMTLYDRQAVRALHEKYPRAPMFKFTFSKYLNKRMAEVPGEFMESLIKDKHHMWSRRPGLRSVAVVGRVGMFGEAKLA